jgi:hypothetical protein
VCPCVDLTRAWRHSSSNILHARESYSTLWCGKVPRRGGWSNLDLNFDARSFPGPGVYECESARPGLQCGPMRGLAWCMDWRSERARVCNGFAARGDGPRIQGGETFGKRAGAPSLAERWRHITSASRSFGTLRPRSAILSRSLSLSASNFPICGVD